MLSFPPTVAPTKVLIVPLSSHADFKPFVRKLTNKLQDIGVSNRVDDSGASIGKRYSRNDELGTPLGITIDVSDSRCSCTRLNHYGFVCGVQSED